MKTLELFNKLKGTSIGRRIFTWLVCRRIPDFSTIRPTFLELREGRVVVQMKERKKERSQSLTNHSCHRALQPV